MLPSRHFERNHVIRFIQEALTNCAKHSGADEIRLSISHNSGEIMYRISDSGCGFDPLKKSKRTGLTLMQFNADEIGGDFEIQSSNEGTTYFLNLSQYKIES